MTETRLAHLEAAFTELGLAKRTAYQRALVAYAVYVGLLQLAREVPERLADEKALASALMRALEDG